MDTLKIHPSFQFVFLHLTNLCNLSCSHCYVSSSPSGEIGLSKGLVIEIINCVSDLQGNPTFILSGGEPLSRKADCLDILEYATGRVKIKLLTNGTLFGTETVKKLAELKPEIRVSIDGYNNELHDQIRGSGSFAKLIMGIDRLLNAGFPLDKLTVCATLVDYNEHVIMEFLKFASKMGIENVRFNALCRRGRGVSLALHNYGAELEADLMNRKQGFSEILSASKNLGWSVDDLDNNTSIFSTINIYSNGFVFPYIPHDHIHLRPHEVCAGNVKESSLIDIIRGQKMQESILKKFLSHSVSKVNFSRAFRATYIRA